MGEQRESGMNEAGKLRRREFLYFSACALAESAVAMRTPRAFASESRKYRPITDLMPARPTAAPLDWGERGNAFNNYIMNPDNKVLLKRPDGSQYFASALEGSSDGGLTTFGPVLMGKILRGDPVDSLIPSMAAYFNDDAGIFLDGVHADLCEYWYLMNVNALADGIIRSRLSHDLVWTGRVRKSADRLIELAHQIDYNFNDQGYRFNTRVPFTNKDIYRQPDAVGGYAYLMLFAHEMFGEPQYLKEATKALDLYQSFPQNPWYEVPSGAMAALAAARLSVRDKGIDMRRVLSFVLDPGGRPLQTGVWGASEVNGLMAGFRTEPAGQAYSMESLVTLPYILPVLRYRPEYAVDIGKYLLNTAANMRWFYSDCIPRENQSRPGLTSAVPYERLSKEVDGKSPFASGDYGSDRSVYGGAYALWWGELVKRTEVSHILQMNISRTDFLCGSSFPSYVYYNPWGESKRVELTLGREVSDIYDLSAHRMIDKRKSGSTHFMIPAGGAQVVVIVPSGAVRKHEKGILFYDGNPVDYNPHPL